MFIRVSILLICTLIISGCQTHDTLTVDKKKALEIKQKSEETQNLASGRKDKLFNFENENLSHSEKQALDFLYAWMPLSDLSNHTGDFYLQNVRYALKAKNTLPWGKNIPDKIFLHYVLPHRVNNEYTDTSRVVFYNELKDRVKNLSLKEAALEVNHWCQEKVIYHSTDEYRTSAPLSTVKTAYGRCGEQSTFTVAAMRSVGIPARQIYTPRWAHTNDNHAWVEVWIDGNWYFMGACEPEPELNMGWFESPATRAMLTHHRTYGHISTSEEIVTKNRYYTEINTLEHYAPTKTIWVKVQDEDQTPLKDAVVNFQLPNFAEFYNIASIRTNNDGIIEFTTGLGDLMVQVIHNQQYAWEKLPVPETDTLLVTVSNNSMPAAGTLREFLINTPQPSSTEDHSNVDRTGHAQRLKQGDSIRNAYVSTFIDSLTSLKISNDLEIDPTQTITLFKQSRGNWDIIKQFLEYAVPIDKQKALTLLSVISDKDRRDTPLEVFTDHFDHSINEENIDPKIFRSYILNPRIANEKISAYKAFIRDYFDDQFKTKIQSDVSVLVAWIHHNIEVRDSANAWGVPQLPSGVLELKVADTNSRNILFVAIARSFGIPSRINLIDKEPQVLLNNKWTDVDPDNNKVGNSPKGVLRLTFDAPQENTSLPEYFKDFTLNRFEKNQFKTLDFSNTDVLNKFPASIQLDEGLYSLVTVRRLPNGSSKTRRLFFEIKAEQNQEITIKIPEESENENTLVREIPINLNQYVKSWDTSEEINVQSLHSESGLVLIWIDPAREPSKHLLNDLIRLRSNFNNWNGNILLLTDHDKITPAFSPGEYPGLPTRTVFATDDSGWLSKLNQDVKGIRKNELPVALVINGEKEIIYHSSGYRIGIGDDVLNQVVTGCAIP
ncbi:transglutaminase domain-containing protein [Marinilabilia salmonicolor]|uniref:Transglutaminase superfamily protein n=1 Tax=Marinilabilia salmonicolor TaxID=989 RepID=A0A368VF39_9BACT|nr:transglutaminase domain-containing protein [Marinilabilia salmonicolor]RCW37621.1 transglutaminase superfamily protein [Marinilabilia salmonicolor]